MNKQFYIGFVVVFFCAGLGHGQPGIYKYVGSSSVGIANRHYSTEVTFSLRNDEKDNWRAIKLKPRYIHAFHVGEGRPEFKIQTDGKKDPVKYSLDAGKRYAIYWNSERGLWDLVEDKRK